MIVTLSHPAMLGSDNGFVDFFQRIFDTDFMARGDCVSWRPEVLWLHVISDGIIALSYYSIPLALIYFVRKRRDVAFVWMFVMFAAFILACGTTHVMSIIAFWAPFYRLDGVTKAITALVSVITAVTLWPLIPKALALPSPAQLQATNTELAQQVRDRERAEVELQRAHSDLERRVAERTGDLARANKLLESEVAERRRTEQHQEFLVAELDHRVKNTLSTVLAMAEESIRSASSVAEFEQGFVGRVRALARTHAALAAARWEGVPLQSLVRVVLDPYSQGGMQRVACEGDMVTLSAKAASTLCLTLNELATNAAKYGAFSTPAGTVSIRWRVEPAFGREPDLTLVWSEAGGPAVVAPTRRGFGTQLIEDGVAYELGGKVVADYRAQGLVCTITIPLNAQNTRRGRFEHAGPINQTRKEDRTC